MTGYRPMTLADLAGHLVRTADGKTRWKLVWEFLEEYRWEPEDVQPPLVREEPPPTGDVADVFIVGGAAMEPGLRRCPRHA